MLGATVIVYILGASCLKIGGEQSGANCLGGELSGIRLRSPALQLMIMTMMITMTILTIIMTAMMMMMRRLKVMVAWW